MTLTVSATAPTGDTLVVFGEPGGVLSAHRSAVPSAVATIMIAVGEVTGRRPRCVFAWPAGGRPRALARVMLGHPDTAADVHMISRRAQPDRRQWPIAYLSYEPWCQRAVNNGSRGVLNA